MSTLRCGFAWSLQHSRLRDAAGDGCHGQAVASAIGAQPDGKLWGLNFVCAAGVAAAADEPHDTAQI